MYISILHKQIYTSTSVQINVNSPVKKWSCQFLNICFLAPILETSTRKVIHLIRKMAHKKAILDKFILASSSKSSDSSGDCRSPIHNGSKWLIPETSLMKGIIRKNRRRMQTRRIHKTSHLLPQQVSNINLFWLKTKMKKKKCMKKKNTRELLNSLKTQTHLKTVNCSPLNIQMKQ